MRRDHMMHSSPNPKHPTLSYALHFDNGWFTFDPKLDFESFECAYRIYFDGKELHRGVIGWDNGRKLEAERFRTHDSRPPYGSEFVLKTYDRYGGRMSTHRLTLQRKENQHET